MTSLKDILSERDGNGRRIYSPRVFAKKIGIHTVTLWRIAKGAPTSYCIAKKIAEEVGFRINPLDLINKEDRKNKEFEKDGNDTA